MNKPIIIECPFCKKNTELENLEAIEVDENMLKRANELKDSGKMTIPKMSKIAYEGICKILGNDRNSSVTANIEKIKPHKVGLFEKPCVMSNRKFRFLFIYIINHETKTAGVTFHIDEEVKPRN